MTYTSLDLKDIEELSYPQYQNIVGAINRRISWDLQLSVVGATGQFENELNPLYSDESEDNRVFKMSDAEALKDSAGKQ